jgi:acyl-coenzyme A thioesterase PaaI-like protein
VIAAVLDGAMGHWLFAHRVVAVTIELNVSFRHPLHLEKAARVEAKLIESSEPIYMLKAHICQEDRVVARATGRFVRKSDVASTRGTNNQ